MKKDGKKKKLLFQSDFSLMKTGFGRNARALLSYLHKTGKYEILHYCCGIQHSHVKLDKTPWKSIGALPDDEKEKKRAAKGDPSQERAISYGSYYIDAVVRDFKPDVYIAVQDIWGVDFAVPKKWFNKTTSCIWTTLDSLPILPSAVKTAKKVKNYWIWSGFATKELLKLGHDHVQTLRGAIECRHFKKLDDRDKLRKKFDLTDYFVIGFVFRNQLRKSVPNLLEGYSIFKKDNPEVKTKLLLHTFFQEGWGIMKLAKEYNIPAEDIVTTYVCSKCMSYEVLPYTKEGLDCDKCDAKKSVGTTNIGTGVSESKLNEIYNLMDVYCHPFTSGGQEIPIQEAKLTELITLVTNYSCGEDSCVKEAASLPLDWSEYREQGTEFRKASTSPQSICDQLQNVYDMPEEQKAEMGIQAREWVLSNFDTSVIGKTIADFIDDAPFVDESAFEEEEEVADPNAEVDDNIKKDSDWLVSAYHNILKMYHVDEDDDGHKYWMKLLDVNKANRSSIKGYFCKTATENIHAAKRNPGEKADGFMDETVDEDDEGRRIIMVVPESAGDIYMATSLFPSIKRLYPDHNLYFACKEAYKDIILGNPNVHKWIPYLSAMEDELWLEGSGDHKGWFEVAYLPYVVTQRITTYHHNNNKDKLDFELCIS
jgi:glycosyltransferase involved in cell wall biosynthesis